MTEFKNGWKPMDEALDDGTQILVCWNNGCFFEYIVVWRSWTKDTWLSEHSEYDLDHFCAWKELGEGPYDIR